MQRSLISTALTTLLTVMILSPSLAEAQGYNWSHGLGNRTYFMPGGPQEHWMNGCIVETRLTKAPGGDSASLYVHNGMLNGMNSLCDLTDRLSQNWIQIITYDGKNLNLGPRAFVREGYDRWLHGYCRYDNGPVNPTLCVRFHHSTGPYGQAIFGAEVSAVNVNGLNRRWAINVF